MESKMEEVKLREVVTVIEDSVFYLDNGDGTFSVFKDKREVCRASSESLAEFMMEKLNN